MEDILIFFQSCQKSSLETWLNRMKKKKFVKSFTFWLFSTKMFRNEIFGNQGLKKTGTGFLNLPKMDVVRTMTWHKIWRGISVLVLLVEKRNDLKWIPQNVHNFVKINTAYLTVPTTLTVEQSALYAWEASKGPPTVTGVIFVKRGNKTRNFRSKASEYNEHHLEQL